MERSGSYSKEAISIPLQSEVEECSLCSKSRQDDALQGQESA